MTAHDAKRDDAEPDRREEEAETVAPSEEDELADAHSAEGLDDTQKPPEQLAAELDDLRDRLLRAVADAENTRKRASRDVKDARDYAVTSFARDMLDVADVLSRAVAAVPEDARAEAPESVRNLIEGVEMTERKLQSVLERHGVRKVDPAPGEGFDPNRHQAAAQIPAEQPAGKIAHVMQPGYVIGERTLRAAMVVVSAGPPKPSEAPASDGSADASGDGSASGGQGGEGAGEGPAKAAAPGGGVDLQA